MVNTQLNNFLLDFITMKSICICSESKIHNLDFIIMPTISINFLKKSNKS